MGVQRASNLVRTHRLESSHLNYTRTCVTELWLSMALAGCGLEACLFVFSRTHAGYHALRSWRSHYQLLPSSQPMGSPRAARGICRKTADGGHSRDNCELVMSGALSSARCTGDRTMAYHCVSSDLHDSNVPIVPSPYYTTAKRLTPSTELNGPGRRH